MRQYQATGDGGVHILIDGAKAGTIPADHPLLEKIAAEDILPAAVPSASDEARRQILEIEARNPISARALREFILGVVSQAPAAQALPGIQRVAQVEAQIAALRALIK